MQESTELTVTHEDPWFFVPAPEPESGETIYIGKLEPNYYCRGWNSKRKKYCRALAGAGTDHPGQGRCRNHGGATNIMSGRYSEVTRGTIGEHLDRLDLEDESEKLDILPEAQMIRALAADYIEDFHEFKDAILAYNEQEAIDATAMKQKPQFLEVPTIHDAAKLLEMASNVVDKIHRQRSTNAISMKDFLRVMVLMADTMNIRLSKLESHVGVDMIDQLKRDIAEDWNNIKLKQL